MAQVVIIDNERTYRAQLKAAFTKHSKSGDSFVPEIVDKIDIKEAGPIMELVNPDIIICRVDAAAEILAWIEKTEITVFLLVVGKYESQYYHFHNLDMYLSPENVVLKTKSILASTEFVPIISQSFSNELYIPVNLHYFFILTGSKLNCDIYLKIYKDVNGFNYNKQFLAGADFKTELVQKIKDAGIKELHIDKDKIHHFLHYSKSEIQEKIKNPALDPIEKMKMAYDLFELSTELFLAGDLNEHNQEIINSSIAALKIVASDKNAMGNFLKAAKLRKMSYAFSHMMLNYIILLKILSAVSLDTAQMQEKLPFVMYFHDISIKNEEELLKINHHSDLKKIEISEEQEHKVLNHALMSAKLIEKYPSLPSGVIGFILEHHGMKNGIGFQENLSTNILPLSIMFIVVEDFVDHFLKLPQPPAGAKIAEFMAKLQKRYYKESYQQTLAAIDTMLKGKK
jgi:hypothetical protein